MFGIRGGVSEIAKWDHASDKVTFYKTPSFKPQPYGMVHDKNDNIWFALLARCKVVKFDPETEQFIEYSPPDQTGLAPFGVCRSIMTGCFGMGWPVW